MSRIKLVLALLFPVFFAPVLWGDCGACEKAPKTEAVDQGDSKCSFLNSLSEDEAAVMLVDREIMEAVQKGDIGTWERIAADDIVHYNVIGQVRTREELVERMRSGNFQVRDYKVKAAEIRMLGDDVAVVGELIAANINWNGTEKPEETVRATRIYNNQDGQWRLVHTQNTLVPNADTP